MLSLQLIIDNRTHVGMAKVYEATAKGYHLLIACGQFCTISPAVGVVISNKIMQSLCERQLRN